MFFYKPSDPAQSAKLAEIFAILVQDYPFILDRRKAGRDTGHMKVKWLDENLGKRTRFLLKDFQVNRNDRIVSFDGLLMFKHETDFLLYKMVWL